MKKELESVSKALPSLIRSQKLLSRFKREGGFVETDPQKIIEELKDTVNSLSKNMSSENISELLFKTANLSYLLKVDAEQALYEKNDRFVKENTKD